MIFKNHDWHGDGKQEATVSCVFHYENCRASNEAGGSQIQNKQQRKWFFVYQVPDKFKSLPKDAMGLWSIYMISFHSAST